MADRGKLLRLACFLSPIVVAAPCWGQSEIVNEWRQKISGQLRAHLHFPRQACGKGGEAKVGFVIDRTGKLTSSKLLSSSGVRVLDEAALEIVKSAQPFPAAPSEVAERDLRFTVPLVFKQLEGSTEEIRKSCEAVGSEQRLPAVMHSICRGC
jgi:protein TonB